MVPLTNLTDEELIRHVEAENILDPLVLELVERLKKLIDGNVNT